MEAFVKIITACAPVLVALVGIIPTVISNRKKTQESIEKVQTTLDNHIAEDEDERARNQRYRILRFYDELCENRKHSESHFEDILDDIDNYETYCNAHPSFKNNRGIAAMEHIKATYKKVKANGWFLIHQD